MTTRRSGRAGWRRRWLVVGLEGEVPENGTLPCRLGNHELLLWRGRDQEVHAVADRCPHRGTRLSVGFVRAGRLTCAYHGWRFDAAGNCVFFPAVPDATPPKQACLETYPLVVSQGLMWTHLGNARVDSPPVLDGLDASSRTLTHAAPVFVGAPCAFVEARLSRLILPLSGAAGGGARRFVPARDVANVEGLAMCREATVETASGTARVRFESKLPYPGVVQVTARSGPGSPETELYGFVAPADNRSSLLHLVVSRPADVASGYDRSAADAFARYLRWWLENEDEGWRRPEQRPWVPAEEVITSLRRSA